MDSPSLDIKKSKCNRVCSGRVIKTRILEAGWKVKYIFKRLYCKKWSCPTCGPIRAWQLSKDINREAEAKVLDRFLTLTLDPKKIPQGENEIKYIWKVWKKFRVYLGRKFKSSISYIAILELHKSGIPHLHVLVDRYISQQWIKEAWSSVGGGTIVFIEKLKSMRDIGMYLAKYLTKNMNAIVPRRLRRVSTSRDIKLSENREKWLKWEMSHISMDLLEKSGGKRITEKHYDNNGVLKAMITEYDVDNPEGLEHEGGYVVSNEPPHERWCDDEGGIVYQGIEPGTARTRLLTPSSKEVTESLRKEQGFDGKQGV